MEREAHRVEEGILRWGGPLLKEQRQGRRRDHVTEDEKDTRQQ
jgi:hypothetical protein